MNQGFSYYFLHDDRRIRIRIQEAQKHVVPVDPDPDSDPDPQHCFEQVLKKIEAKNCY